MCNFFLRTAPSNVPSDTKYFISCLFNNSTGGAAVEPLAVGGVDHFETRLVEAHSQQALLNDHCARLQVRREPL